MGLKSLCTPPASIASHSGQVKNLGRMEQGVDPSTAPHGGQVKNLGGMEQGVEPSTAPHSGQVKTWEEWSRV